MILKLLILYFSFFTSLFCSMIVENEELEAKNFYIFGIGQGNSQLAVYDDFAVLYDSGSSSQKIHPKFEDLQNVKSKLILSKISSNTKPAMDLEQEEIEIDEDAIQQNNRDSVQSNKSDGSQNSHVSNTHAETRDIREKIKNVIKSHNLKHLFIFVSHPDSDHYNLIQNTNASILPDLLPVTIFLCGDWFNTEDLYEKVLFLRNLSKRPHTWIELPYYWNYHSTSPLNINNYQALIDSFHQESSTQNIMKYDGFLRKNFPNNNTQTFKGSLFELIRVALLRNEHRIYFPSIHQSTDIYIEEEKNNKKQKAERTVTLHKHLELFNIQEKMSSLNQIYILCMNQPLDDVNSQSAIISFNMPSLGMRFICTGDAHNETFHYLDIYHQRERAENSIRDIIIDESEFRQFNEALNGLKEASTLDDCIQQNLSSVILTSLTEEQMKRLKRYAEKYYEQQKLSDYSLNQTSNMKALKEDEAANIYSNYITVLILPHHGSSENISRKMLELFSPDLLVISAGNGILHGHPETETVKAYSRANEAGLLKNNILKKMYFESDLPSCIAYSGKKEAKQIGHLVKFSENLPLLSTNIHGTVSFDKEGVYSDFSNVIEYKNADEKIELFSVNFRRRIEDISIIEELNNQTGSILRKDDSYFYKIMHKNEKIYYNARKLKKSS